MGKDHIVKEIPLLSPLEKSLEEVSKMNEELLGRKDKYHEKIFRTSLGIGEHHHEWIRIMKKVNTPEKLVYASYKTGILLTEDNKRLVSDPVLKQWDDAIKEYKQLTKNHKTDFLTFIKNLNQDLRETWTKGIFYCSSMLNIFINDLNENFFDTTNFEIHSIDDFATFCARRVSKNSEALHETLSKNHYEVSLSII